VSEPQVEPVKVLLDGGAGAVIDPTSDPIATDISVGKEPGRSIRARIAIDSKASFGFVGHAVVW